jgi:hypothetical protein
MNTFGQVLLSKVDPKNDSILLKYTDQFDTFLSLDSLFSIKAGNFSEVAYFNKSSCGHHENKTFWFLRFNSDELECIKYISKTDFTKSSDAMLISKFKKLIQQVENEYLLQEDQRELKCNLDEIFIKENRTIKSFVIGDGGFFYSGNGKISPIWLELINEITMISFTSEDVMGKRTKMTNRKYLKSFKK